MSGINAGTISAELVLKADGFFNGLSKADSETKSFQGQLNNFSKGATDLGKSLTTKLTLPIVGVGTAATLLGLNFDASMSEVQAISGATGQDMVKLEGIARDLGATTKFSANDAADGLKYMSMAGWEVDEMMAALPAVLDLAAASNTDLGTTSDIVTDALTGFGLQAQDAAGFADLLASASSNSNTNVELMGETFKYVAPLFGSLGYSAEDAALATGLMANAGIKGSQAGTSLRAAITNLVKPTDAAAGVMKELGISTTDANGEMKPFDVLLGDLRTSFSGLTEEQKAQKAATLFGKEAMSGMLAIINASDEDFQKLTKATTDYDGAAKKMADTMQDNLKGALNNIKSALEETALKIYNMMLPSLEKLADKIQSAVDWFNGLDEGTQQAIVRFGLFVAAIGPVLLIVGTLAGSISNIVGVMGLFTGAAATAGGSAGAGALTVGLGGVMATATPFIAAGALIIGSAVAIGKGMSEEALPQVERFGYGVSETTREAVGNFLDLEEEATTSLKELAWTSEVVTEEMKESIGGKYAEMKDIIVNELEEQKTESINILNKLFSESETITKEELAADVKRVEQSFEDKKKKTEEGNRRIKEIWEKASKERRELTEEEVREIETLNETMKNDAIRILSESEEEQLIIMRRLELEAGNITARQGAEIVKNSKETKEKVIAEAEEQYSEALRYAEQLRREGGAENEALADKVEKEAIRQKNAAVVNAGKMHQQVVAEAKSQAGEHAKWVDWEAGEIMTRWQKLQAWFTANPIIRKIQEVRESNPVGTGWGGTGDAIKKAQNKAHGTEHFSGGYTWVGEQGRELLKLPKGTKIKSNAKSEKMVGQGRGITQNITINSPKALSPSEIKRKNLQASRQLAAEWGA